MLRDTSVFPASAGMDRSADRSARVDRGFPRERGDGPEYTLSLNEKATVFPASAGMDRIL